MIAENLLIYSKFIQKLQVSILIHDGINSGDIISVT